MEVHENRRSRIVIVLWVLIALFGAPLAIEGGRYAYSAWKWRHIMDIRELKASERGLLASSFFHTDPAARRQLALNAQRRKNRSVTEKLLTTLKKACDARPQNR